MSKSAISRTQRTKTTYSDYPEERRRVIDS